MTRYRPHGTGKGICWWVPLLSVMLVGIAGCRALLPAPPQPAPTRADTPKWRDDRRPYELVWSGRSWAWPLLMDFSRPVEWVVTTADDASAQLQRTQQKLLWGDYVGQLSSVRETMGPVTLRLSDPIPIPDPVDTVVVWAGRDPWDVERNKDKQPELTLFFANAAGAEFAVPMGALSGSGWHLLTARFPRTKVERHLYPLHLIRMEWTLPPGETTIFIDGLSVFHDRRQALRYPPRPRRGLPLQAGQRTGVHTGTDTLPFPVDEATIIPAGPTASQGRIEALEAGVYRFHLKTVGEARWAVDVATDGGPGPFRWVVDGTGLDWESAGIKWPAAKEPDTRPLVARQTADHLYLEYASGAIYHLRAVGASLVIDVALRGRDVAWVALAPWSSKADTIHEWFLPFLHEPGWAISPIQQREGGDAIPLFAHAVLDPWRSNASGWRWESATAEASRLFADYQPVVNGVRNDIHERFVLTVAPCMEHVLPRIPHPPSAAMERLASRLLLRPGTADFDPDAWQGWSHDLQAQGMTGWLWLTTAGIWREETESPSYRLYANPYRGGDDALRELVAAQQAAGMEAALYLRPRVMSPLNAFWSADALLATPDGHWQRSPDQLFVVKPVWSLFWHLEQGPRLQDRFGSNYFWLDRFNATPPWQFTDYDARVPGRVTFSQTLYADGDWLTHWRGEYDVALLGSAAGAVMYAGLLDGLVHPPAATHDQAPAWRPYNPLFKLRQVQPLSAGFGAPYDATQDMDAYLADLLAYGQGGVLVHDPERLDEIARAYYHLRTLQPYYIGQSPKRILYAGEVGYERPTEAILSGAWHTSRLYLEYADALEIWINGSTDKNWTVRVAGEDYALPPSGWVATGPELFVFSGLHDGHRIDFIDHPRWLWLDPRGRDVTFRDYEANGVPLLERRDVEK